MITVDSHPLRLTELRTLISSPNMTVSFSELKRSGNKKADKVKEILTLDFDFRELFPWVFPANLNNQKFLVISIFGIKIVDSEVLMKKDGKDSGICFVFGFDYRSALLASSPLPRF